jgi:hypothetical protein
MIEQGTKVKLKEKTLVKFEKDYGTIDDMWYNVLEVQISKWFDIKETTRLYGINGLWFFEFELDVFPKEDYPEYYV